MTRVREWTRDEALAQRERLASVLERLTGTADREALRRMSMSGTLREEAAPLVEELRALDYLLGE